MSSLDQFMHEKRAEVLAGDYVDANGTRLSCWETAAKIGRLLNEAGKTPVAAELADVVDGSARPLRPVIYDGRVEFGGHVVIMSDGLAYDPLLEDPVPTADYAEKVFGKPLELKKIPEDTWASVQQSLLQKPI